MDIIENILNIAKQKGYTNKSLCELLGKNSSYISDWKKGKSKPKADEILLLANKFNCSVDYLLGRDTTETGPNTSTAAPQLIIQYGEILKYISSLPPDEQLEAKKYFLEYIQLSTECRQEVNSFIEFVKSKDDK